MNKRGTKILIGCVLCSMIVVVLFLIVFRFTQLSCELVSLDPVQLASSQAAAFARDSKPTRSHDETIVMRISAYLEYNIQPDSNESQPFGVARQQTNGAGSASKLDEWEALGGKNSAPAARSAQLGPSPSSAQLGGGLLNPQQQQQPPSSPASGQTNVTGTSELRPSGAGTDPAFVAAAGKTEKRFLPLELKSIESRSLAEGAKHKYILNFNCTKLNMILVHQGNRVYVESMNLELRPASRQETTCEVQLPPTGAFMVADSSGLAQAAPAAAQSSPASSSTSSTGNNANNINSHAGSLQQSSAQTPAVSTAQLAAGAGQFAASPPTNSSAAAATRHANTGSASPKEHAHLAHYYCNKPLRYGCYHYNPKSGPSQSNGILLAELHINGIEFETSTSWHGKLKKVKSDFRSKRSECNII